MLFIPLLACGFAWRKPPAMRARPAKAPSQVPLFGVELGEDMFQPISVRADAVKVEMLQDQNFAFDNLIGFLADVGEQEPTTADVNITAVIDEGEVTLTKSLKSFLVPTQERRHSFRARSDSYNDLLNIAEEEDDNLLNAAEIEAALPWSPALVHQSKLVSSEHLFDGADHGPVMPVVIGRATLERSPSYEDLLSPSAVTADQQATLRSTLEANDLSLLELDAEVDDMAPVLEAYDFRRQPSLAFGGGGTALRFKSVHRENPLLAMAEVNLEAELEDLELNNPTYNSMATSSTARLSGQSAEGVILRATATRSSNIRTASVMYQTLDEPEDDKDFPFVLGNVLNASQITQALGLPSDASDEDFPSDASGQGTNPRVDEDDQDGYLALNPTISTAKRGAAPQSNPGDDDDQEEYMAIDASGRGANPVVDEDNQDGYLAFNAPAFGAEGVEEDNQDGYLALNAPVISTAKRGAAPQSNPDDDDDQEEYMAIDASGRGANPVVDEDNQDGYLALNAIVIDTAKRGSTRPANNASASHLAFDPSKTPLPADAEMSAYLSEEEDEDEPCYELAADFTHAHVNPQTTDGALPEVEYIEVHNPVPAASVVVVDGVEHEIQHRHADADWQSLSPAKFPNQPPPPPPSGGVEGLFTTESSVVPMLSPEAARQLDAEAIALARRPPKVHPELLPTLQLTDDLIGTQSQTEPYSDGVKPIDVDDGPVSRSNSKFDLLDPFSIGDAAMLDDDDSEMFMTVRNLHKTAAPSAAMFAPAGRKMFVRPSGKKFSQQLTAFAGKRSQPNELANDKTEENVFVRDASNKRSLRLVSVRRHRADPSAVRVEPAAIEDTTNVDDTTGHQTNRAKFAAKKKAKGAPPSAFRGVPQEPAATAAGDGNVFVRDPRNQRSLRLVSIKRKPGSARLAPAEIKTETADHGTGDSDDSQTAAV